MLPVLAIILAVTSASLAAASESRIFKLCNSSNMPVTGFYISPSGKNKWSENILVLVGKNLDGKGCVDIDIAPFVSKSCNVHYDIKATLPRDSHAETTNTDLCDVDEWRLNLSTKN